MRKNLATVIIALLVGTTQGHSQNWSLGGNIGLSLPGGSPGFHLTPTAELLFHRTMSVGSEFSINTQYGAPLIWYPYFKYYFGIRGSRWKPYADVGPVLALNVPNGPCLGILFGVGVNIPVANRLFLAPDPLVGPMFNVGGGAYPIIVQGYYRGIRTYGLLANTINGATVLTFSMRAGVRYEI